MAKNVKGGFKGEGREWTGRLKHVPASECMKEVNGILFHRIWNDVTLQISTDGCGSWTILGRYLAGTPAREATCYALRNARQGLDVLERQQSLHSY